MGIYSFVKQNKTLSLGIAGVATGVLINFANMFRVPPEIPRDLGRYQQVREELEGPHLSLREFMHLDTTYANFAIERGREIESELSHFENVGFEEVERDYNESVENYHIKIFSQTALGTGIGLFSLIPFGIGYRRWSRRKHSLGFFV